MSLFFEHQAIKRALAIVGLVEASAPKETAFPDGTVPVVVGWSSRGSLMVKPEYALLSLDEVRYVQLPQPLELLRTDIEKATKPYQTDAALKALQTLLGQWHWALKEFRKCVVAGDLEAGLIRLSELKRFGSEHWPGYYERTFSDIALTSRAHIDKKITSLDSNAEVVAVLHLCQPIMSWMKDDAKATNIGTLKDVVAYLEQSALDIGEIGAVVSDFEWMKQLESNCFETEKSLTTIRLAGFEPNVILGNRIESFRNAVLEVRKLTNGLLNDVRIDHDTAKIALNTISKVAEELAELESSVKTALAA